MPIGDLLASISGGPAPKRKAEDDIRPSPKLPRRSPPLIRPLDRRNATRSSNGTAPQRPSNGSQRPINGHGLTSSKSANGTHRVTKSTLPSRPPPPSKPVDSTVPPKKGSYAEIMARAKAAQATFSSVGKIQHKKVEKGAIKKDKELALAKAGVKAGVKTVDPKMVGRKPTAGYTGTAKPLSKPGMPARPSTKGKLMEEKRHKKAAAATTGYTGTARPRAPPQTSTTSKSSPRGGALLNKPPPRKQSQDYDEELDDFIEYDDEDEPGYRYDSASDSDMEAGMDDLELEERRAEAIAKREDIEEERRERMHKAAKEDRKRRALEELRSKRR